MGMVEEVIRSCWEHYAFDDAIMLAELYFSEKRSDRAAFLLATSYFRNGQYSATYEFLKNFGIRTSETKFLFARCCEQMNKLTEAEDCLGENDFDTYEGKSAGVKNEFGSAAPFVHALLGRIYGKTNRPSQAISEHRAALTKLPVLFESYKDLRNLGAEDDASKYFNPTKVSSLAISSAKGDNAWTAQAASSSGPRVTFFGVRPQVSTPEIVINSIDTPPFIPTPAAAATEHSANSSGCKTPYMNNHTAAPNAKLVPKAPIKNPNRRTTVDSNGSRIVTRQQSQRVLTQNQSKITTRRSARLFQSSVKENENDAASSRRDRLNSAKIAVAKKIARPRRLDTEKPSIQDRLSKMRSALASVEKTSGITPVANDNKKHADLVMAADDGAFFEELCKLAEVEASLCRYDSDPAIDQIQNLMDCHRSSPMGLLALARAYFERANYQKAGGYFREIRLRFPYFVKGMEYYSTALWHLQRDIDLSALAQELTEQHHVAPESWCSAGNCFSLQKDHDTAVRFFQRAIQLDPHFAYAYTLLGHEYIAIESYDQALQCFRVALRLRPRHYNAWYGIGLIYCKQEKIGLARIHLQRALDINPRNSVLMCHVSLVQQSLEDKRGAMKLLDDALTLSPRNALCRYQKAQLLFNEERHAEALAELQELKQLAPKEPMVYFLAGKVHKKMGQPHLALMNFSWATELDPRGEQGHPGSRRYDEEPVTALDSVEPDEGSEIHGMDSDDSS